MNRKEVFDQVLEILRPYAKNKDEVDTASDKTTILQDLDVNSSRLVDIVLKFEDSFDIEIDDDEVAKIETIGAAVDLIMKKTD